MQKTPKKEIDLALILKNEYFNLKMKKMPNGNIRNAQSFEELLDIKYEKIGIEKRDIVEEKA